jgi:GNAT superfamily N-acetyltransferase
MSEINCGGSAIRLTPFTSEHFDTVMAFAKGLPAHDLLFLSRNIQHERVTHAWVDAIAAGEIESLLAFDGDVVVGTSAIVRDPLGWSAHVADIRLLIAPQMRGKGLGRAMLEMSIKAAVASGATKLMARMTPDQRSAITLFEECGFRGEAMLRDQVRDSEDIAS